MSQGPEPQFLANTLLARRGLWGDALVDEMRNYSHRVGLKMVWEMLPQERNFVTMAEETDWCGLIIRA